MTDENKMDDRLVHLEVLEQKESQDLNLRPKQLTEFIGQPQAVSYTHLTLPTIMPV